MLDAALVGVIVVTHTSENRYNIAFFEVSADEFGCLTPRCNGYEINFLRLALLVLTVDSNVKLTAAYAALGGSEFRVSRKPPGNKY
jgi:hypothetical protein